MKPRRLSGTTPCLYLGPKPICAPELACSPWWVAWSSSTIVIATKATEPTKIRSIVGVIPMSGVAKDKEAPERSSPRASWIRRNRVHPPIERPSFRNSPPDHALYVATMRQQRDLIPFRKLPADSSRFRQSARR